MLLRISLVVALAAGIAAFFLGHVRISERINTLTTTLKETEDSLTTSRAAEKKAKAESKQAREELAEASMLLENTTTDLKNTTERLREQEKRANTQFEELTNVKAERNEAQQELNRFIATGLKPEQIAQIRDTYNKVVAERDAYIAENEVMLRENQRLENQLARYEGPEDRKVPLPPGLTGRVVAVDPKYDFVVLDIGGNQGVLERGEMLINRDGKLVGKVQITRVEPNRSIANIMPDWKQDEVMEGDQVVIH